MEKIYSEERAWRAASVRPSIVTPAMQRLAKSFSRQLDRHEQACWESAVAPHAPRIDNGLAGPFALYTKKNMIEALDAVGIATSMRMTRADLKTLCEKYVPVPVFV